ncbi:MAG: DUF1553 domain-containing protein [Bryobacteraceae bacterium]
MRRVALLAAMLGLPSLSAAGLEADARGILERRCLGCHGPKSRAGGLDLSSRASALRGGSRGPAIEPGAPAQSLVLARVRKSEMPPSAPLPVAEQESLRRWVEAGAPWHSDLQARRAGPDWWSLQPLKVCPAPETTGLPAGWRSSAIDRWVFAKLAEKGLRPAPAADRRTLIRRLSFDLTGLPPAPEEIDAFVADRSTGAYERLVDRLLNSPHYGERWARHWLDVVRFAESEGFERDWLREHAWRYRDYVIRSFNLDKPYDRFAKEQIAGDVLEPVTHDGITATGLLVLGPTDAVGLTSAVPQERASVREDQLEEMLGVVGQTFLGLTVNCARCHDHKFDPVPQKDYYRLKAVFEGVWQPTLGDDLKADGRALLTPDERAAREARSTPLRDRISQIEEALGRMDREARRTIVRVREGSGFPAPIARWTLDTDLRDDFGPLPAGPAETGELVDGRFRPAGKDETVTVTTPPLPVDVREKTLEAWLHVRTPPDKAATFFRIRNRSGFRGAAYDGIQFAGGKSKQWENASTVRFRSQEVGGPAEDTAPGRRIHIAIAYGGDDTIRLYRNGQPYGAGYRPELRIPAGRLQTYVKADAVVELTSTNHVELEEARLYDRALTGEQVAASYAAGVVNLTAPELEARMTPGERQRRAVLIGQLAEARQELQAAAQPEKTFAAEARTPDPTFVLIRGDVKRPGERVPPAALSAIAGYPGDLGLSPDSPESERRRRLAEWVAHPSNPLFARVMVNRVWHYHFGAGMVESPSDFGYNGGLPSHPELLDWLAAEFRRSGWSLKRLHKLIVLSETYRQSSRFDERAAAVDTANRLLWRFTPLRLDGEDVRDAMLAASGALNQAMYGPSFRPFDVVKNPGSYHIYRPVDRAAPEDQRRTVYRMNVNSGGNPMLESLDCPLPSVKAPKRSVTTTALQALSLMNNEFVQRQAKAFAERLKKEGNDTPSRVRRGFRLALGRDPEEDELAQSLRLAGQHGLETFCWGLFNASEFLYVR